MPSGLSKGSQSLRPSTTCLQQDNTKRWKSTRSAPLPVLKRFNVRGSKPAPVAPALVSRDPPTPFDPVQVDTEIQDLHRRKQLILSTRAIPSEDDILEFLQACERVAKKLAGSSGSSREIETSQTPNSAILALDEQDGPRTQESAVKSLQLSRQKRIDLLSNILYEVLVHPPVFISPSVLSSYITIQSLLHRPATFPTIFHLYATKPVPQADSKSWPPTYTTPNPHKIQSAIPKPVADLALDTAISTKDLHLALSTIETTVCAPAFRRSKIFRRALPPLTGLALTPAAAYALSSQLAHYQTTMDIPFARGVAFAGILAYVGFTATIGMVAITTANDQMDRVTWAQGMPLRERWLREEERAMIDRVAGAWGFRDASRRGEEEGEEWEGFKEWVGTRGMVLDRVELMEGME
ncbi:MAG: hypothetical protein M1817_006846 [Caeruleum heppii]|nr:MAG: hypothetical protein M1817_006846 [Caeruleum heppii]